MDPSNKSHAPSIVVIVTLVKPIVRCCVRREARTLGPTERPPSVSILRRCRFHDLLYFRSRGVSRIARPLTNTASDIPGTMADLSGDIPGTVPYFRGHIARRMADGSTRFFQWRAGQETTEAQNYRQYCFNRKFEQCIHPS